jgi:hypothetical protein
MRKTLILTVLGAFLLAGLAPAVVADRDDGADQREKAQEKREQAREKALEARGDHAGKRWLRGNITVDLSGSAVVKKDNLTYTFTLDADGKGLVRMKNGTAQAFAGRLMAHVVVSAANGTVVKEGDLRVRVFAHLNDEGNWTWAVESVGKRPSGVPRLVLHGQAEKTAEGAFSLSGKGHAVYKTDDDKKARPAKLADVEGTFTFVR